MTRITHPTHPGHTLTHNTSNQPFKCNGCNKEGVGSRYSCGPCDFDLHEYCGTCPTNKACSVHTCQLTLVNECYSRRVCNVCNTTVSGMYYTCRACNFDCHPLCSQQQSTCVPVPQCPPYYYGYRRC